MSMDSRCGAGLQRNNCGAADSASSTAFQVQICRVVGCPMEAPILEARRHTIRSSSARRRRRPRRDRSSQGGTARLARRGAADACSSEPLDEPARSCGRCTSSSSWRNVANLDGPTAQPALGSRQLPRGLVAHGLVAHGLVAHGLVAQRGEPRRGPAARACSGSSRLPRRARGAAWRTSARSRPPRSRASARARAVGRSCFVKLAWQSGSTCPPGSIARVLRSLQVSPLPGMIL